MKILVANLGSTSFKYRLFDMNDERQLARGGVGNVSVRPRVSALLEIGDTRRESRVPGSRPCRRRAGVPGATDGPRPWVSAFVQRK